MKTFLYRAEWMTFKFQLTRYFDLIRWWYYWRICYILKKSRNKYIY